MSTHRRAWKQRAGVVVALVAGALLTVPATAAQAAEPGVQITGLSSGTLDSGQRATLSFRVTNNNAKLPPLNSDSVNIKVSTSFGELSCSGRCDFTEEIGRGDSKNYSVTLVAGDVASGQTKSGKVQINASIGGESDSAERDVTVRGPQPQEIQTVKYISGKVVVAANGEAVPNAMVMLRDSQGHQYQTTSDGSGNYRFTGSSSDPISPGRIDLGASKDNTPGTKTINASAGQSLTGQRIALALKVEVSPSATPSASVEALPTEEVTEEATDESAEATPGQAQAASNDEGGSSGSFLIILLGGLLVAAGVGTIVLLWVRRKNADEDDEGAPAGAAAGAVPGARGAYRGADDHTRVVNRAGAGPDPTMVGGTSLSDAPTMMHRPVVDDVPPDPYGAPPQPYGAAQGGWAGSGYGNEPAQGGYGQQGSYGNAPSSGGGYGNAPSADAGYGAAGAAAGGYGNAPSADAGYGSRDYGAPAGGPGYGSQEQGGGYGERYDEPTGRYTGDSTGAYTPAADPYPTSTYQPEQGHGYGEPDPAPYGRGQEPAGGYGGGTGYGGQGGGYDASPQQQGHDAGYNQRGGYDQQGGGYGTPQSSYDQQGGHDRQGGYDQQQGGGYGAAQGGYGQQGGYDQEPPQQRTGGYDDRGYDQQQGGGYYGDQAQAGRGRPDGTPQQDRGGRRLDWLDD
ncbi:carboxypeptidase-like regulatory domain-containing protein [Micromonospora sp. NPDC047548]|uniref:carboxypeptidase-like regulatory domain-containing protein n=1 Tax=Micromonospora sp. NPDC047548 TaxID=3155624 RepID=UPI0033E8613C